jgi:gliding motility-associated-like protein
MNRIFFALKPYILACLFLLGFVSFSQGQCPTGGAVITKTHTDITCFGDNDGTITVELGDGAAPLNFELYDNVLGAIVTLAVTEVNDPDGDGNFRKVRYENVYSSSFQVVVFKSGCLPPLQISETPFGFFVAEPAQVAVSVDAIDPDCDPTPAVGNGGIDITPSGGIAPYTFLWSDGSTAEDRTGLDAGSYTVTVTDANGCSINQNVVVPVSTQADAGPPTGLTCGTNSFALSGNAAGIGEIGTWTGPPGVTFTPSANDPNATANNLGTGANILTWTITDTGGLCVGTSDNTTVTFSPTMTLNTTITNANCNGASTGAIDLAIASGGIAPFTFLWSNGATTEDLTNIPAGTYSVTVTDASTCTATLANITVTEPLVIQITSATGTNLSCNGTNDGSINVVATGGTGALVYTLNPGAVVNGTGVFNGLAPNTYTVSITDANGCGPVVTSNIIITEPAPLVLGAPTVTNASCGGALDGQISITATGGTGALTYTLNPGAIVNGTGVFPGLGAGTYTVTVDDAGGCAPVVSGNITITEPPALVLGAPTVTNASCTGATDGQISITATGGTGALTYTLNPGAIVNGTGVFPGLGAGTYTVTVDDAGGCAPVVSANITITAPPALIFNAPTITNVSCFGATDGQISITATGGTGAITYTLNPGAVVNGTGIFPGLGAGTYTVTADDAGGCAPVVSSNIIITAPAALTFGAPTVSNVSCFGATDGQISITATGGTGALTYTLNPGAVVNGTGVFPGLGAGTYTVTVDDAGGCAPVVSSNITITAPAALTLGAPTVTNASCGGVLDGQISITATGGTGAITYTLNPGAVVNGTGVFPGLGAGTYTVTADDAGGCAPVVSANITVTSPAALILGAPTITNSSCGGALDGQISITATGGTGALTYTLNPGAVVNGTGVFPGLGAGTYTVTVDDAGGCAPVVSSNTIITSPPALTFGAPTVANVSCFGATDGQISITATGGTGALTYTLNPGAVVNGTGVFPGLGAGTYTVTVDDAGTCPPVVSSNIIITAPAALTFGAPTVTNLTCAGAANGQISITATGGTGALTYTLNPGAVVNGTGTFPGLVAGTYTVTVDDAGGCAPVVSANITVTEPVALTFGAPTVTNASCGGALDGQISITATGGTGAITYTLNPGAVVNSTGVFPGLGAGTYTVTADDAGGCAPVISANITITSPPALVFNAPTVTNASCGGTLDGQISITATGGTGALTYTLNPGAVVNGTGVFPGLGAGTYTVTVDDAGTCASVVSANIIITEPTALVFGAPTVTNASCGGALDGQISITATGGTGALTYTLNPGAVVNGTGVFPGLGAGTYTVTVDDAGTCAPVVSANIILTEPATLTFGAPTVANASCGGALDGQISITATGGTGAITYTLNPGAVVNGTGVFPGLGAGTYTVTADDAGSCAPVVSANIIITEPAALTFGAPTVSNASCGGTLDGQISITATGGTGALTYTLNPGAVVNGTGVFPGLGAGTYTVTVDDAGGCAPVVSANIIITEPAGLTFGAPTVTNASCGGALDGQISITATGGTGALTYTLNPGAVVNGTGIFPGLGAGTYTVTVDDAGGCAPVVSANITITEPAALTFGAPTVTDATCGGALDGQISITATGGTGALTYTLNPGAIVNGTGMFPGLGAGTYTVTVDDAGSCAPVVSANITIAEPLALTFGAPTITNASCGGVSDGQISITATGGTGALTYTLNPGAVVNGTGIFPGLAAGIYTVTVDDAGGCAPVVSSNITITEPTPIVATISGSTNICGPQAVTLTINFTGGSSPWFFTYTETDANGTTTSPEIPSFFSTFTFPDTPTLTTTYTLVSVRDGSCTGTVAGSAVVTVNSAPDATLAVDAVVASLCSGASTDITVTNSQAGITYQLRNDAGDINIGTPVAGTGGPINLPTGPLTANTTFNVLASATGCTSVELTDQATVTVGGNITAGLAVNALVNPLCSGSATSIRISGSQPGVTYQLRNDAGDIDVGAPVAGTGGDIDLPTGALTTQTVFNVLASNATCSVELTNTVTIDIDVDPNPGLTVTAAIDPLCVGGDTDIRVDNSEVGVTYQLRNDAGDINIGAPVAGTGGTILLNTGTLTTTTAFNVFAASGGSCPSVELTNTVTVNVSGTIDISKTIVPVLATICQGSSTFIRLSASDIGVSYQLRNDADDTPIGLPVNGTGGNANMSTGPLATTTTFNVLANNGTCSIQMTATPTVNVDVNPNPALTVDATISPLCINGISGIRIQNSETGVTYQLRDEAGDLNIGAPVAGTGGTIVISTGVLTTTTTFNVLASSGGACADVELATLVTITVGGTVNNALNTDPFPTTPICAGDAASIIIQASEVGVNYQLRNEADDSNVGAPVAGTGGDINLPTGNLTATTTFNVLASNGTCSIELTDTETITVNPVPGTSPVLSASPTIICANSVAAIQVTGSEVGISYQLRNHADNSNIGTPVIGTGSTISLPTGPLAATTDFNVLASNGTCAVELGPITVTVRPVGDPFCDPTDACGFFLISIVEAQSQRPSCSDQNDGIIALSVDGSSPTGKYEVTLNKLTGPNPGPEPPQIGFAGVFVFPNLSPGSYQYIVNDFGGHICTRDFTIEIQTTVEATATGFVDAACFGEASGRAVITITGGNSPYEVSTNGIDFVPGFISGNEITNLLPNGTYNILVRDDASDACPAEVSVTINSAAPAITATFDTDPATCLGTDGSIHSIVAGGGSGSGYEFSIDGVNFQSDSEFSDLGGGGYTLTVRDGGGCTQDFAVNVTFPGFIDFTPTASNSTGCLLSDIEVAFANGGTYEIGVSLSPNVEPTEYRQVIVPGPGMTELITGLGGGDYYVWVKSSGVQCPTRQGPVAVVAPVQPFFNLAPECVDNQLILRITNLIVDPTTPVTITVVDDLLIEQESNSEGLLVVGGTLVYIPGPGVHEWLTEPGRYTIKLSQFSGDFGICPVEYSTTFDVPEPVFAQVLPESVKESYPDILTGAFTVGDFNDGGTLPYQIRIELDQAAVGGQDFETDFEEVVRNPDDLKFEMAYQQIPAGIYIVQIVDALGCSLELTATVPLDTDIFIPNLFTPNNDGHNDEFFIRNLPESGSKLTITNRWGNKVYSTGAYQNNWTAEGVEDGIYFYHLKPEGKDALTGWVEVLRGNKP